MRTELLLPYPPSVNGLFANRTGGRFKTKKYKAWITEAGWMVQAQTHHHHRHLGHVRYTLEVRKPDNRRRDLDNLHKAVQDLMVRHQIIKDDSQIIETRAKWIDTIITLNGSRFPQCAKVIIEDV